MNNDCLKSKHICMSHAYMHELLSQSQKLFKKQNIKMNFDQLPKATVILAVLP